MPETRYAKAGDAHIAYQVLGDGPIDVVLADQWFSHMEAQWEFPPLAAFRRRLASFSRVIMFDKRGIGMSDPVPIHQLPNLETWMDDLRAVMDAAGSERAALVTNLGGSLMAIVCAASFPDRISSLVIADGFARVAAAADYEIGEQADELEERIGTAETDFGRGIMLPRFAPSVAENERVREAWARYERQAASPGTAEAMVTLISTADVRDVLPAIRVPTLVLHHADTVHNPVRFGRYLAEHIPGAKLVVLPGRDSLLWAGDQEATIAEIQEFITGVRPMPEPDRVLSTVLFTDIVDSTARAADLGDRQWRTLLAEHDDLVSVAVRRAGGRTVKTTGDGVLATFDGPARAVRAATAIRDQVRTIGLEIRAALHTGEIEVAEDDIAGVAVHIASRVLSLAGAGEVLVSGTVRDLIAGAGIVLEPRGIHVLKGVPGEWAVLAVDSA
jgi:class 3 adenylate cyclase